MACKHNDETIMGGSKKCEEKESSELLKFPESLTNADHMIKLSIKPAALPDFDGAKDFLVSPESKEKTSTYYQQLESVLSEERVCRKGSLSVGKWLEEGGVIIVDTAVGSVWKKFGTKIGKTFYALPEEGLFLIEQGLFELYLNGLPLTVQEAWMLLMKYIPSVDYYCAYTFLCRQGFGVVSSQKYKYFGKISRKVAKDSTSFGLQDDSEIGDESSSNANESVTENITRKEDFDGLCRLSECKDISISHSTDHSSQSDDLALAEEDMNEVQNEEGSAIGVEFDVEGKKPVSTFSFSSICQDDPCHRKCATAEGQKNYVDQLGNAPLVQPSDAVSVEAILAKLQIIKPRMARSFIVPDPGVIDAGSFKNTFPSIKHSERAYLDVYYDIACFKKSSPGVPDCKVYICNYADLPPSQGELQAIFNSAEGVPVKFAVCNSGSVTFYGFSNTDISIGL